MSSHPNDSYGDAGRYLNHHRGSFRPSPGDHRGTSEQSAPLDTGNVNQGIARSYGSTYHSQTPIDGPINYYSNGMSNTSHYTTVQPHQQGYGSGYPQHPQGTMPIPCPPGQTGLSIYSQSGVNPQWPREHGHHHSADFGRSASWSPPHISQSAPPLQLYGSASMSQLPGPGRVEVSLPQRSYIPHHRQNYFEQFNPENPIIFPRRYGGDGVSLADAVNESFDYLVGRDDPMFPEYGGPAISLRLEWPGYKPWTKQIKTKDWRRDPRPITKSKLAHEVAKKVRDFIQDNANEPVTAGTEKWRVGPGFIEVKDLVLVRMVHVSKGSWQAEFRVFE